MPTPYDDTFTGANGSTPDPTKWTLGNSPDIQDNMVEIQDAGTTESITSLYTFSGDFEVQISFTIPSPPVINSWNCKLNAVIDATHRIYVAAARISGNKNWQRGHVNGGSWVYRQTNRTNDYGGLKISRSGNEFTVYEKDGPDSWAAIDTPTLITVGSVGQEVTIVIENGRWDSNPTIICRYDDYLINSGGPAELDDGTPTGGIVFGGEVEEIRIYNVTIYNVTDPLATGGIVFGGGEVTPVVRTVEDIIYGGGIVFGGLVPEVWVSPYPGYVAVTSGTYRIDGTIYTLADSLYYEGLGDIAALVGMPELPMTTNYFRYDVLEIGIDGAIHVVEGTEGATPTMPSVTADHVKVDHVLRYEGQVQILQSDVGRNYTSPVVTRISVSATDDELAWTELTTNVTVTVYDQYDRLYKSSITINASFLIGNGTIAPLAKSTSSGTETFVYPRGQEVTDESPIKKMTVASGAFGQVFIALLDESGVQMMG